MSGSQGRVTVGNKWIVFKTTEYHKVTQRVSVDGELMGSRDPGAFQCFQVGSRRRTSKGFLPNMKKYRQRSSRRGKPDVS